MPKDAEKPSGARLARLIAGRYRLNSALGSGSMGTVWSATDEFLHRSVAVKQMRLPSGLPAEEAAELRERALREARAIAALTHPNVVTLYDVVREAGEPFVVMELVPSSSLAAIIDRQGRLDDRQLAVIADGVAAALEAAHRAGIIHRDIKPGNVLVGADVIKLSDFGIARNVAETTITAAGVMLGTPAYIAPEIVVGSPVSTSADLWGLGATLFAASEGRPPYDAGGDPLATITAIAHDPAPTPQRSGPLGEIITGLLTKDPALRMPLAEIRSRVRPLLTSDSWPFERVSGAGSDLPTVPVRRRTAPARAPGAGPASGALASRPGPLPFAAREPMSRRRSPWALVALGCAAMVVCLCVATGAFAAIRAAAGRPLIPGESATATVRLVRYTGTAEPKDQGGSEFAVLVPAGWTVYQAQLPDLGGSGKVSFVSPDGRSQVSVQRFDGMHTAQDYLNALPSLVPGARVMPDRPGSGPNRFVSYTVTDTGLTGSSQPSLRVSTLAELLPRDGGLWLLGVSFPGDDEASGKVLFDQVRTGFAPGAR